MEEKKKIKFKTCYDEPIEVYSDSGSKYYYTYEWEKPLAKIDPETGEIIQASGDPKPIRVVGYDRYEKIQAALPSCDMMSIIARSKLDPTQFMLTESLCGDMTDIPINDFNALQDLSVDYLKAADKAFDNLTDEQKVIIGDKSKLYEAILSNQIDSYLKERFDSVKKEEEVNNNA